MRKKTLLILCHELPPIGGGAGNFTRYLSEGIDKTSTFSKIVIVTSNYKRKHPFKEERSGIVVYRLPIFRRFLDRTNSFELMVYTFFSFIVSLFMFLKYDFNFVLAVHGIPSGISALLLNVFTGIPYGVSLRGGDVPGFLPQRYSAFHRRIAWVTRLYWKKSNFITFNAEETYHLTKDLADRMNKEIHIIPNGVDCDFFAPPSKKDFNAINMVYSGRLTEQKNVGLLLRASRRILKERNIKFSIDIAGDGELKSGLEKFVAESGMEDCVKFHGWLDKDSLKALYQRSHIFVLPSLYEGMSNSLLEAMACGLAVISTDFKGYDRLIKDGENGFLVESDNEEILREKILYLLNNTDIIKSMCEKSRERALGFSWEKVTESYLNLIKKNMIKVN